MKKERDRARKYASRQEPRTFVSRYREGDYRLVSVYVEGYDDVAFWRGIFDDYETDHLKFEISVPPRPDLAKGKRVLLDMVPQSGPDLLLCMDSDFDYLFDGHNEQSRLVLESPYVFHTYAYATENYLCYPPSLHRVCAKSTKNDTLIFDFEEFMANYSRTIYPLFVWYAYSARRQSERAFSLIDFRSSVRLNYLDVNNNGADTIAWLARQVDKRIETLEHHHLDWREDVDHFAKQLTQRGVLAQNIHLFMQGHTLLDNVVVLVLQAVCERLREMTLRKISAGTKQGMALRNEVSNYTNALRNAREVLLDNEAYKECFLYKKLKVDIEQYIESLIN